MIRVVDVVDVVGAPAACGTTFSFVPQVMKVWTMRSGADISTLMYSGFMAGSALWFAYGVMLRAWPIVVANGLTFVLAVSVLVLKMRFARNPAPVAV